MWIGKGNKSVSIVTVSLKATATDGKNYQSLVLPLSYLNGFLFGISLNRVKPPKTRDKLFIYQKECYRVLHEYFDKGFALNESKLKDPWIKKAAENKLANIAPVPLIPLTIQEGGLNYTFLIEENINYGVSVLKHSVEAYVGLLRTADSNITLRDVKRRISRLAGPEEELKVVRMSIVPRF